MMMAMKIVVLLVGNARDSSSEVIVVVDDSRVAVAGGEGVRLAVFLLPRGGVVFRLNQRYNIQSGPGRGSVKCYL